MIHIQKVHIEGYKSILDAEVEFLPGLNVIIGKNGAGKSNLLAAMEGLLLGRTRTLLSASVVAEVGIPNQSIGTFKYFADARKSTYEPSTILFFANSSDHLKEVKKNSNTQFVLETVSELVSLGHSLPTELPFLDTEFSVKVGASFKDLAELLKGMTDAQIPYPFRSILANIYGEILHESHDVDHDWNNVEKMLKEIVSDALGLSHPWIDYFVEYSPIEDVRLRQDFSVLKISESTFQINNAGYEFQVGGSWLPYSSLSDGTKRLVVIILSLCLPRPILPIENGEEFVIQNNLPNRVIFLEEPELGIHPHQLHQLLQFLKAQSRKHQIIITTHSPQVLDILGKDELDRIIIASYDAKQGSKFKHLNPDQMAKAEAYRKNMLLSDYWRFQDLEPRTVL